jgi:hypothetical protein
VLEALALGRALHELAALGTVRLREIDEVLAGITVLGKRRRQAELLLHARLERARQRVELIAGVVDVELGRHRRALAPEEACERVTDGGRARVDDDERTGGIRRHELEADAAARLTLAASVRGAGAENFRERARAPRRREEDVEKSRARRFDALDLGHRGEVLDDELGDLSRRALRGARQHHRRVRRVIAVLSLARHFPRARVGLGQARLRERRPHAVGQPIGEPHSATGYLPDTAA